MLNWKQYIYQWNVSDNGWKENCTLCSICSRRIQYEFEIVNRDDENDSMIIGCECVKKFDSDLHNELVISKRKLLKNKKIQYVLDFLVDLSSRESTFDYNGMIEYFEERGWFTPKQILLLIQKSERFRIPINPVNFKVMLTRDREKFQLRQMSNWDKLKLTPFLSKAQSKRFIDL